MVDDRRGVNVHGDVVVNASNVVMMIVSTASMVVVVMMMVTVVTVMVMMFATVVRDWCRYVDGEFGNMVLLAHLCLLCLCFHPHLHLLRHHLPRSSVLAVFLLARFSGASKYYLRSFSLNLTKRALFLGFLPYGLVDRFYCVWSCSRVLYRVVLFKKIINI